MDYQAITDTLLKSGQDLVQKAKELADKNDLSLPKSGPERDEMIQNLSKGAAMGGLLAVMLGTGLGRKLTGTTLKLGSLAALGTVAYQTIQKLQGGIAPGTPVNELSGPAAATRSQAILKAIIAAAKADGHIDDEERGRIEKHLAGLALDRDSLEFFKSEMGKALSARDVAAAADSPAAAAEIYLVSLAVIGDKNAEEQAYLNSLASELKLSGEVVAELEANAKA